MSTGRALLLVVAALVAGCHGDSHDAAPATPTPRVHAQPPVKRGPTPDELTAGMVEAVTMGASTVPVAVKFELDAQPVVGQPVEVIVAVMPQIVADAAVLAVNVADGLQTAVAAPIEIPSVDATQVYRHNIRVTPTSEGVQLLGLSVSLKHDDITETRVFAVPLIVAAATPAAPAVAAASAVDTARTAKH